MAVGNLLKGFGSSASTGGESRVISAEDTQNRLQVLDDFEQTGISWIWATDQEDRLIYFSPSAEDHLKEGLATLLDNPLADLFEIDPDNGDRSDRPLNFQLKARNKIADLPVRLLSERHLPPGKERWWSLSGHPKFDNSGKFLGYRGSAKDVTQAYQRAREDSRLAEYDSLTGLANRHRMNRKLESTLAAYKSAKRSCALLMMDLDKFKQVNDTLGHQAGDDLLRQVADRLKAVIGERGEIARLGGDEFQVMLPDEDDRGTLGDLSDKIIQMLSSPYQIDGKRAIIGASVGVSVAPYDGVEAEEIIHNADLALYAAKNSGRGTYRFYSADLKDSESERAELLDDLREALATDQLELHYQPVVRTRDNHVVGFEALMRWEHPERGSVSPAVFIPAAEESDLINQLGQWALRRACEDAMGWPEKARVAVNVSAKQFANRGFPTIVTQALAESGIDPDRVELELTETVFMGDTDATDATFEALKGLGVRLALDDFGTGYSSLSYLRSAPFDKIKVDKSFVDSCTQKNENSSKIITAIIGLSKALGMEVTVEGVEAFDQLEIVCSKGAEYVQGWIYSKALPQEQILDGIATGGFTIEPDGPETYRRERRSVFRRIGVIHEDHRYEAVMKDLSQTGSLIEGLVGIPKGTGLVLDLGGGQLVVCTVARSKDSTFAVEFETPLVSDGAGGLVTRHRVSPYALAAAGMPLAALPPGNYPLSLGDEGQPKNQPQFMQVTVTRS
ncbi:putative bifunctional diguanylate cyclase/phosphodiesterase [Aurantiacibacter sp. D1-12]|uniref:putative bifunctional diguanylate cyclase/phosphodiesterase n=1 Tax=Aurantiacibacter sp. D1-12 TaxID=2993658 RepID=UPI00237C8275|nr:EAL domain-containing protein [Aurantiacibacter sp. D1-12]MDE1466497.1 EAL domain-containing protein [Aurantiacibacter sp. D1-12]